MERSSPRPGSAPSLRTLFLSDLHLGALGGRPDRLLDFLIDNPAETYILVGDVLDLWQPLLPHWSRADQAVIDHLRARATEGAQLVYLVGNHDPDPKRAPEARSLPVDPITDMIHEAADGRRYLVLHGDVVDSRLVRAHVFTRMGSRIDHCLRRIDHGLRWLRGQTRDDVRSTIECLLSSLNSFLYSRRIHERQLVGMARVRGLDGVICGHFHIASLQEDHGLIYANCGDWVDSFSAIGERHDGSLSLLLPGAEAEILPQPATLGEAL